MNASPSDLFIVIRSAGERSLPLCIDAVQKQTDQFTVIEEYPFLNALKKTFALAANQKTLFTLALDADVILYPDALKTILIEAHGLIDAKPLLLGLDCYVKDKFRGFAISGCHLYVNSYATQLAALFAALQDSPTTKPERSNLLKFAQANSLLIEFNSFEVGLHDYEQFYNHLYIKYYRRAVRYPDRIADTLAVIEQRRQFHPNDLDFTVVEAGFRAGIGKHDAPFDARYYPLIHSLLNISEKPPLI